MKGRDNLGDLKVDGKIILKLTLKNWLGKYGLNSCRSGGLLFGLCKGGTIS